MILRYAGAVGELVGRFGLREGLRISLDLFLRRPRVRFTDRGRTYVIPNEAAARHHLIESLPKLRRLASFVRSTDSVIVDIGAHAGLFSAFAIDRAPDAEVTCVEPDATLHPLIEANLRGARLTVIAAAVVAESGAVPFYRSASSTQTSSVHRAAVDAFGTDPEVLEVRAITLDEMCRGLDHIDVLKVDVQGAESLVIAGARETLKRTRTVLMEVTFLDPDPVAVLGALTTEFGDWQTVNVVVSGADLAFERSGKPSTPVTGGEQP